MTHLRRQMLGQHTSSLFWSPCISDHGSCCLCPCWLVRVLARSESLSSSSAILHNSANPGLQCIQFYAANSPGFSLANYCFLWFSSATDPFNRSASFRDPPLTTLQLPIMEQHKPTTSMELSTLPWCLSLFLPSGDSQGLCWVYFRLQGAIIMLVMSSPT